MKLKSMMLMAAVLLVAVSSMAMAAENGKAQKEQLTGADPTADHYHMFGDSEWMDKFHHPTDGVTLSLDQRIRHVYAENSLTMDKDTAEANNYRHYGRYRTRFGAKFELDPDIDINTRLVWEWRIWEKPATAAQSTDFDEILFDRLNITMRNAFDMPLTLVIGRQDIILGGGWLVLDGTPQDGSRTIFFDAVRATYVIEDKDTTVDMIYIQNYDDEDKWLKPFNHNESQRLCNGVDERGLILYVTDKSPENGQIEYYYIFKDDKTSIRSTRPDAEIHTFGGALQGDLDANWDYRAEVAKQFGRKGTADLHGWAANNRLKYKFNDAQSNAVHVDYEYMSGDNKPGDGSDDGFDPLWGEYPQAQRGGDLSVYLWATETTVAELNNFHRLGFGHSFKPAEKWQLSTMYNLFWADEQNQAVGGRFSADGNFRGQMLTAYLKYRCCKQLSAHFLVDYFMPGDYYVKSNRDHALFTRFNLEYTF